MSYQSDTGCIGQSRYIRGQSRNISKYFTNKKLGLRSNTCAFPVHFKPVCLFIKYCQETPLKELP